MVQFETPSYRLRRGRLSHVPLHRTTAIFLVVTGAVCPKMVATRSIVSCPPTGQLRPSSVSAFTQATAKEAHPGKPHPPQLAAGNASCTSSTRGSSSTLNRCPTRNKIAALPAPMAPNVATAVNKTLILICILNIESERFCHFIPQQVKHQVIRCQCCH